MEGSPGQRLVDLGKLLQMGPWGHRPLSGTWRWGDGAEETWAWDMRVG